MTSNEKVLYLDIVILLSVRIIQTNISSLFGDPGDAQIKRCTNRLINMYSEKPSVTNMEEIITVKLGAMIDSGRRQLKTLLQI